VGRTSKIAKTPRFVPLLSRPRYVLFDPAFNANRHSIHNHCILKSLALTAPGGYVAVLTSRYTLDSSSDAARREMAAQADLVGAIRLPSRAFWRVAGTEVVTDLLILRRRDPDQPALDEHPIWLDTTPWSYPTPTPAPPRPSPSTPTTNSTPKTSRAHPNSDAACTAPRPCSSPVIPAHSSPSNYANASPR
jgi:hypothetical protein